MSHKAKTSLEWRSQEDAVCTAVLSAGRRDRGPDDRAPFFLEAQTDVDFPPPINHPKYYYGFKRQTGYSRLVNDGLSGVGVCMKLGSASNPGAWCVVKGGCIKLDGASNSK